MAHIFPFVRALPIRFNSVMLPLYGFTWYLVILLVLLVVKSPETKAQETRGGVLVSDAV